MKKNSIILFDGDCNFCDKNVQFIIKHDKHDIFRFTSLQSEKGLELIEKYNIPTNIDSVVLIENDKYYIESDATLRISKNLNNCIFILYIFIIIPKTIRDYFYKIISKNRYGFFGKKNVCLLPTKEQKEKFL